MTSEGRNKEVVVVLWLIGAYPAFQCFKQSTLMYPKALRVFQTFLPPSRDIIRRVVFLLFRPENRTLKTTVHNFKMQVSMFTTDVTIVKLFILADVPFLHRLYY